MIPTWIEAATGAVFALGVLAGVFWFTFARMPERRIHGEATNRDLDYTIRNMRNDDGGL